MKILMPILAVAITFSAIITFGRTEAFADEQERELFEQSQEIQLERATEILEKFAEQQEQPLADPDKVRDVSIFLERLNRPSLNEIRASTLRIIDNASTATGEKDLPKLETLSLAEKLNAKEVILDKADFLPAFFVVEAAKRQSHIGRVIFKQSYVHTDDEDRKFVFYPGDAWGTCFLVAPNIIMTNNHVIESKEFAQAKIRVQFNYQRNSDGTLKDSVHYNLAPSLFFHTNKVLDYTLVGVSAGTENDPLSGPPGGHWGFYPLAHALGPQAITPYEGMAMNIIQHPNGRPKEIAIHNNKLDRALGEHFLVYTTDTQSGSSGSPVFDNSWTLVALHHAPGEVKDDKWVNNRGIRIRSIINDLLSSLSAEQLMQLGLSEP
ncbi:MAG: serine protease [Planctomycetota bacterium]